MNSVCSLSNTSLRKQRTGGWRQKGKREAIEVTKTLHTAPTQRASTGKETACCPPIATPNLAINRHPHHRHRGRVKTNTHVVKNFSFPQNPHTSRGVFPPWSRTSRRALCSISTKAVSTAPQKQTQCRAVRPSDRFALTLALPPLELTNHSTTCALIDVCVEGRRSGW